MPKIISDEFTDQNISAQRRYQLRKEKAKRCRICGDPGSPYCKIHHVMQRNYQMGRIEFVARAAAEAEVL